MRKPTEYPRPIESHTLGGSFTERAKNDFILSQYNAPPAQQQQQYQQTPQYPMMQQQQQQYPMQQQQYPMQTGMYNQQQPYGGYY